MILVLTTILLTNCSTTENTSNQKNNGKIFTYQVSSFCKLIQKGNFEGVKFLIESGEDVNQKSMGLTPLMFAARHNRAEIAKLLIRYGAKLNVKSEKEKMTALKLAKRFKAIEVINIIENSY